MKQWTISDTKNGFDDLKLEDVAIPQVGETEVLVKLHAASLNFRDLIIPKVNYSSPNHLFYFEINSFNIGIVPFPSQNPGGSLFRRRR